MFRFLAIILFILLAHCSVSSAITKDNILLVYREGNAGSLEVANYYQSKRGLADEQILGISFTSGYRDVTFDEYKNNIETPILAKIDELETQYGYSIKVVLLSFGIPTLIPNGGDPSNSVDSELVSARTFIGSGHTGYYLNPYYSKRQSLKGFEPSENQNMLLVMRVDGPDVASAKALVDHALEAENEGVSGAGYFDVFANYPTTSMPNKSIVDAYNLCQSAGFEAYIELTSGLMLPPEYPGDHTLFYYGWYNPRGFTTNGGHFQWQPGSIGTHLYSGGAHPFDLRFDEWCPGMVVAGVSGTQGSVAEGYTLAYSEAYYMLLYMLHGFSYAEAAYASNIVISWVQVFIGDPLLRWPESSFPNPPVTSISLVSGGIKVSWKSIYKKTYIVEYSDGDVNGQLSVNSVFTPIPESQVTEETNPGNGESYISTFQSLPLPSHGKRYYRVKFIDN
ncbi:MAG: TIGR03790 family protein [Candidatus Auribacter fodinae]|jgi:uncharacterized protein (TIGR03790 family)|uniref:TIGR03790 family protein n=1 Tax=Candidatus Auribacter fodinae TaxID=2093366 RepID=A0A3A4RAS5_9BACT|nr:MAG: TIGR03790 family protein [Candidatus Auribacter fodinae]